jgi:hypothetical protein
MPDSQLEPQRSKVMLKEPTMASRSPKMMNLLCMSGATSIFGCLGVQKTPTNSTPERFSRM